VQRISDDPLISSTWTPSFYGYDGHGNVRYLTGSAGTATDTYVYDAFGLPITTTGTTPNSFLYSGEQFDSVLGVYRLKSLLRDQGVGGSNPLSPTNSFQLFYAALSATAFFGECSAHFPHLPRNR
jgi:hypothetical protein